MPRVQSMEENTVSTPCSAKRSPANQSSTPSRVTNKNTRIESESTGDSIKCCSQHCKACAAVFIADSVAVCCCPLAVISLLTLAFVKIPYMVGKRCVGIRRSRRRKKQTNKVTKCWKDHDHSASPGLSDHGNYDLQWDKYGEGKNDIVFEFREGNVVLASEEEVEEERRSLCGGFEQADRFFLELYQVGQLGFGRVSFTGSTQSSHNNNNKSL